MVMTGAERNRRWKQRHREAVREQKRLYRQRQAEHLAAKKRAKRNEGNEIQAGPGHPSWVGDDASYETVHERLRMRYGKAKGHNCVDCGEQAAHWSYNHTDPNGRLNRKGQPYSTDLSRYDARCVLCHNRFDREVAA